MEEGGSYEGEALGGDESSSVQTSFSRSPPSAGGHMSLKHLVTPKKATYQRSQTRPLPPRIVDSLRQEEGPWAAFTSLQCLIRCSVWDSFDGCSFPEGARSLDPLPRWGN